MPRPPGSRFGISYKLLIPLDAKHKQFIEQQLHNGFTNLALRAETASRQSMSRYR